jgi:hypothetical protein
MIVGSSTVGEPIALFPDHSCRISVNRHSVKLGPALCTLNFCYRPGVAQIRMWDRKNVLISLHNSPQGMAAKVDGSSMTAKQLAVYYAKKMYERVKFPE